MRLTKREKIRLYNSMTQTGELSLLVQKIEKIQIGILKKEKGLKFLVALLPISFFTLLFRMCAILDVFPIPFEDFKKLYPDVYEDLLKLTKEEKKDEA